MERAGLIIIPSLNTVQYTTYILGNSSESRPEYFLQSCKTLLSGIYLADMGQMYGIIYRREGVIQRHVLHNENSLHVSREALFTYLFNKETMNNLCVLYYQTAS